MGPKEALERQFRFFYRTVRANLAGLSAEDALVQPGGGGNCANWTLGHLVYVQNAAMRLVRAAPVWENPDLERVRPRSGPIRSAEEALDWDAMRNALLASEERFVEALRALPQEVLDQEGFTDPTGEAVTRAGLLLFLAGHQLYHSGQLGLLRRVAGHEGAIRGPAPQPAAAS
ncbi:MAG TPA: DinB family protein [Longimicrobiales bacterium]|nr:DinB family protein [Longimicrobiales bacterium]